MIIYLVTNTVNNKVYIGQTTRTLKERWREHVSRSSRGSSFYLHNAIRKYGERRFTTKILNTARTIGELNSLESKYILTFRTNEKGIGYNLREGGLNGKLSQRTRKKMSAVAKKRPPMSEEVKLKISKGNKGKVMTAEARRKIGAASRGHTLDREARSKISKALRLGDYDYYVLLHNKEKDSRRRIDLRRKARKIFPDQYNSLDFTGVRPYRGSYQDYVTGYKKERRYKLKYNAKKKYPNLYKEEDFI